MCANPSSVVDAAKSPDHVVSSIFVQAVIPLLELILYKDKPPSLLVTAIPSSSNQITSTGNSPDWKLSALPPETVVLSTNVLHSI